MESAADVHYVDRRLRQLEAESGVERQIGLEVQIEDSRTAGYYDTGAIYDLVKPTSNAMKPVGEWNHLRIKSDKNLVDVWLNQVDVNHMDLNEWAQPYERPDGTKHKFNIAWKYHSRTGYIGLQKHGGTAGLRT